MPFKTVWTEEKVYYLVQHFATCSNASIVAATGVSERSIQRKAKELGLAKDETYIAAISRAGLMEIDYQRMCGRKMGPPKGLRCNPKGEFKKGHKESNITRARRVASLRARADSERQLINHGMKQRTKWKFKI